ncbi:MAG: DNA-directed RNA polymerase subunit L [Candidatus Aenigmatarchaeota archaeon]|nr:DNA-directed RNA polymerase subunit L [Nanoarchaeota archaeon]
MKLRVVENKKDKLRIEVVGESHTLLNLLRETAWKEGAEQASYIVEHPYMSNPELIIRSNNPKNVLSSTAQSIVDQSIAFEKELKRVVKK